MLQLLQSSVPYTVMQEGVNLWKYQSILADKVDDQCLQVLKVQALYI
jgi:hypothetical protein